MDRGDENRRYIERMVSEAPPEYALVGKGVGDLSYEYGDIVMLRSQIMWEAHQYLTAKTYGFEFGETRGVIWAGSLRKRSKRPFTSTTCSRLARTVALAPYSDRYLRDAQDLARTFSIY